MSSSRILDWRILPQLKDLGILSRDLLDGWYTAKKTSPIACAMNATSTKARSDQFYIFFVVAFSCGIPTLALGQESLSIPIGSFAGLFLIVGVVALVYYLMLLSASQHISKDAASFVEGLLFIQRQARRLSWTKGGDLVSMQSMDHGELNMLAYDILVAHAKDVLAVQTSIKCASNNPEKPEISDELLEESRTDYDAAMADLKKAYNVLKNFSLVAGEGYGPYFKAAQ